MAQVGVVPLVGTYVSDITSNTYWRFTRRQHRQLKITFSQQGNEITGINQSTNLKISGIREGDEISFFTWPSDISSDEIKGEWRISADGSRIEGRWTHPHGSGRWNLRKVR